MAALFARFQNTAMTIPKANLMLLFAAFVWGSGFVGNRWVLDAGITPFQLIAARMFIASVCLNIFFRKQSKSISKGDFKIGILIGAFLFAGFATQTYGLMHTTAAVSAFVTAVYVILTPFMRRMLIKDKLDMYANIGALLTVAGIGLISLEGGFGMSIGIALTLVCAVCYALQTVFTDKYTKIHDPINLTIVMIGFNFVCAFIASIIQGGVPQITVGAVVALLYLGIVPTFIAYLCQNIGQKYTTAVNAAIIMSTEAVFGALLSVLILREVMSLQMVLGMITVFGAIIIAETKLAFIKRPGKK
ncbi:MAG: DMT family transporter [Defluviitaleaceae bacterium]|nr:DMT family transporter [Defluviitaleaceae bacterium]